MEILENVLTVLGDDNVDPATRFERCVVANDELKQLSAGIAALRRYAARDLRDLIGKKEAQERLGLNDQQFRRAVGG